MPGRGRSKKYWAIYHAVREQGKSKTTAAKIAGAKSKRKRKK